MITKQTLKQTLLHLGFTEIRPNVLCDDLYAMAADLNEETLKYPINIEGRTRNADFQHNENFVVFECIYRLLKKGYRAEDIELEKEWHLGHDAKSGRADIIVYKSETGIEKSQRKFEVLFIIECKTYGDEYNKELKNLMYDGGQLFSYFQQERSCEWLCLYASNFNVNKASMDYQVNTIKCTDDLNLLSLSEKDKKSEIKLFKTAYTAPQLFNIWQQTYDAQLLEDVIFKEDTKAYEIGIKPLLKKDLIDFSDAVSIINKFEEILRHNNVSDKENAFNRLIALFICKLVDEITKSDNDEVEFQYKIGTDTYETLQDRLQRLHKEGMDKFMKEKILYISDDYPALLIQQYTNKENREELIKDLKNTIRILKFYTNNDFAFKDVHNEELFYQNGKLLVEVIELFQNYKIIGSKNIQLLGDLFEKLLDKGFKQNEGQFFTPTPITKFIWLSLPLERILFNGRDFKYPKIIDYACGAGHFLTEGIEIIRDLLKKNEITENFKWYSDNIYGIEKDYRLARVSKVSMFMHGAGDSNIIFGDGLDNYKDKGIDNEIFDILVANPPYSVKGFKPYLNLKENTLDIINEVSNDGSEIEVCFIERIAKLLKPKGIASVILPSSILSNNSTSYVKARECILKNFYIRAITSFGSLTFGATGTNTVVLFLEKFNEPPKRINILKDSINAIFNNENLNNWEDRDILNGYVNKINVSYNTYASFLKNELSLEDYIDNDYFKIYTQNYFNSSEYKKLLKSKYYISLSEIKRNNEILNKIHQFITNIEKEKIAYFSLVYKNLTVVVRAPEGNKEQKEFLGYKWSDRTGAEGIQIIKMGGMMFDIETSDDNSPSNFIKNSFKNIYHGSNKFVKIIHTMDMLDFSRDVFNKSIALSVYSARNEFKSKYPLETLGSVCNIAIGGTPSRANIEFFKGNNLWVSISEMKGQVITDTKEKITDDAVKKSNVKLVPAGTTLLSFKLSIGKTAIAGKDLYTNEAIAALMPLNKENVLDKYLFYLFTARLIDLTNVGNKAFGKSLNCKYLKNEVKIPIPPISIQNQIINECEIIDNEYNSTRMSIENYYKKIEELFDELDVISMNDGGGDLTLTNNNYFEISIGKRVLNTQLIPDGTVPVFSANVKQPFGYLNQRLLNDFSVPSVLWGIDGDWMVSYMPENKEFYPTDHCGVLRCKTSLVNPRYLAHLLEVEGTKMGFSRAYRASIDRIKGISFSVPTRDVQDKFISKIMILEKNIADLSSKLNDYNAEILNIVNTNLN